MTLRQFCRHTPISFWISITFSLLTLGTVLVNTHYSEQLREHSRQLQTQVDRALAGWDHASRQRDEVLAVMEQQRVLLRQCVPGAREQQL